MNARLKDYDLSLAFDSGVAIGATYLFVMYQHMGCSGGQNEFCKQSYFVMPAQNIQQEILKQQGRLLEIYDLSKPKHIELASDDAQNFLH